ncbi:MAG TPA: DUF2178 domain-containing protein [Candidatus Nanoarchaeia archaeon]|nr:DUF2178 domain-containing protein [Candidatus Nanoarchaeia archaeon]
MKAKEIDRKRRDKANKIKSIFLMLLAVTVAGTLFLYALTTGKLGYSAVLIVLAALLIIFFGLFALRRYKDAEKGMPFEDERSRRVMEKAAAKSFFVSLYLLLAIGWLSEGTIIFRDVSQASSAAIGIMAVLFFAFWVYYNRKEI